MTLTRASLLRRALVGGAAITFGKLPDVLAKMPPSAPAPQIEAFEAVRITTLRTAVPSAARLANIQHAHVSLDEQIALLEPNQSPLTDMLRRQSSGQLGCYAAQRVDWLEDELMPRSSDVLFDGEIGELTVAEPQYVRYFLPGDVLRNSHSGELLHVDSEVAPHVYRVRYIGHSEVEQALIDQCAEMRALREFMPAAPEQVRRFKDTRFGSEAPSPRLHPHTRFETYSARAGIPFDEYERNRLANGRRSRNIGWDYDFDRNVTPRRNVRTTFAEWSRALDARV